AVIAEWGPTREAKIIVNLPTTVEAFPPNVYADRLEWFQRHVSARDRIILSVHPHNDRGTAVATAELGLMAGADRVEGTLFGNGERTGNVDLVTIALNLLTQGVDPQLDLSERDEAKRNVQECDELPIHLRHPWARQLELPRGLQVDFAQKVQAITDVRGDELTADELLAAFHEHYLAHNRPYEIVSYTHWSAEEDRIVARIDVDGEQQEVTGTGNGPI